jgi:alkylated DNA nucleotide flippase Atl1
VDRDLATAFIAAIPEGQWTSYTEVALAGGSTAHAVAQWLTHRGHEVACPWRVLTEAGVVPPGWQSSRPDLRPDIPGTRAEVRLKLKREGVPMRSDGSTRVTAMFRYDAWRRSEAPQRPS